MGVKSWLVRQLYKELLDAPVSSPQKTSSSKARDLVAGLVKKLGLRFGGVTNKDFTAPEDDLTQVTSAYATDSYVRQGVDKYVDQIFKEGYEIFGKNPAAVEYLKLRLAFISEGTGIPTGQLLQDIAEDVVKYSNAILVKARMQDPAQLPPGMKITGLYEMEPVVGFFPLNPTTMKVKRDKNGTVQGWQQEVEGGDKPVKFRKEDIVHIYYKRVKGNAFGTPFLMPVLDDVRALRQAEENTLRLMYRHIYPFYHVAVGTDEDPGRQEEVEEVQSTINNMEVEGGIATTNRVKMSAVASDQVINAEPYLKYFEARVFTGMGIPAILFGRGNSANRNTGDNMTTEMADRIRAIQNTIAMCINEYMFKEILMEGGYDPVMNPDDAVELVFHENDTDRLIKAETHAMYQYEHNSITEDEMRILLGRDPITDRAQMYINLVEIPKLEAAAAAKAQFAPATTTTPGTKATNNKQKPTNQYKTKTSPKKNTNSEYQELILDEYNSLRQTIDNILSECYDIKDVSIQSGIKASITYALTNVYQTGELLYNIDSKDSEVFYARVFTRLNDVIMLYIDKYSSKDELRHIVSATFDIVEDKINYIATNKKLFERKEEKVDEAKPN